MSNELFKNNFDKWTSGNELIDSFIQKMQLKIDYGAFVFEWIPYDKFIDIKETRVGKFAMAIWKDGPLYYDKRKPNEKILLKYLVCDSQSIEDYILIYKIGYHCENCGEKYNNKFEIDSKSCLSCQINHENNKINDLIQVMKLNIDYDPSEFTIWRDGLLYYSNLTIFKGWSRKPNTHNSQNFLDEFINEVKAYPNQKMDNILKIYGISQDLNTKDYIMVFEYAEALTNIIDGLSEIHQNQKIHRDFHVGNILFIKTVKDNTTNYNACISDMGLYQKSWIKDYEIEKQFNETQEYRKKNLSSIINGQLITHTQAVYSSRLLNPYTKNLYINTVEITDFTK
ncbi:kinase-like domain-containing protein [Rhizophagus clarus]|uniref:Kinase-like domain-containing protein n=1 Tax=Rhizophagus clarus TaxID=94130 RepID=A0A8H3QC42_9GLOM|nr:kinase-like domain-containing protein [Rhizophagus clarus]